MPQIIIELTEAENKAFELINADGAQQWIENAMKERARIALIDIRMKLIANSKPVTGNDLVDITAYESFVKENQSELPYEAE
jgi:hypothetical protein